MKSARGSRILWALAGAALAAFLLWSVLFETLLPLIQSQDWPGLLRNVVGVPLLFTGVGLFIWSAFLLLRDFGAAPGWWRWVLLYFLLAVLLIAFGGYLTR